LVYRKSDNKLKTKIMKATVKIESGKVYEGTTNGKM
jgi:hypothetical protein